MKDTLREQYRCLLDAWHRGLDWECQRSAIAFLILVLLAFGACMASPALLEQAIGFLTEIMGGIEVQKEDGSLSALALFLSNFEATAMIMTYGLFPFLHLSAMSLGVNAVLLGIMAAWYLNSGYSMMAYLAAVVPHGIFELPAMVCAIGVGLFVCGQLSRRIRHDKTALPLWSCLLLISQTLVLVLLPLLIIAAFMEAYVTPVIASWFF